MTRALVGLWITLLMAIVTISVLAQFWISSRQRSSEQRVSEILISRLVPFDNAIERVIDGYDIELRRLAEGCNLLDTTTCQELTRSPLVGSLVIVGEQGQLLFPSDISGASRDRQTLVDEAQQLLKDMMDPRPRPPSAANTNMQPDASQQAIEFPDMAQAPVQTNPYVQETLKSRSYTRRTENGLGSQSSVPPPNDALSNTSSSASLNDETPILSASAISDENLNDIKRQYGWITWYHRRGMVLGFWWNQGDGRHAIATIPRGRWMADIVAALPDASDRSQSKFTPVEKVESSKLPPPAIGALNQLIDVEGNVIYQWSALPSDLWSALQQSRPGAVLSVTPPLEGWRLRVYASPALARSLAGDNFAFPLWLAVGSISVALLLGGALVTTMLNRQVRLATRRVSFVNQVSHELRTPLTNICMYADLLSASLEIDTDHPPSRTHEANLQRITVIQNESQRLNRLIGNVLQFARLDKPRPVQRTTRVIDDVVQEVMRAFEPGLAASGIELHLDLAADDAREFDPDVVEQILINLIGNAEKYAASGRRIDVSTRADGQQAQIIVQDYGPGITPRMREKVFLPFFRLSDRLEDPAGTGIGLTIVRDLARNHGGDCQLLDSPTGARFCCTIHAPVVNS
ncbi:MAG: HAMP domain-containing sensor histidine kinase [Pirellulaceae bacterium]